MKKKYTFLLFFLSVFICKIYAVNVTPLEVFTEENFGGTSQQYEIVTRYQNLGEFDNKIKSFKLKQGYMVTFASNSDGTGYSRVFIAQNADLLVPVMPSYLKGTVSFIRTMVWHDNVTKKGLAGGSADELAALKTTWYYNWNSGLDSTPDREYVPIRQTFWWPGFEAAYTKEGYTHLLGYNEPDRPDQANISVDTAISGWPGLLQSGLRLGSPAPSDPWNGWLQSFLTKCDQLNYRVDAAVMHCYWYKSAAQWKSDLEYLYTVFKRPFWITEWNIGANWTGNNFPDGSVKLTDANAIKHKNDIAAVLNVLDNLDFVERYSIYNWVEDSRAMFVVIDDAFKTRNPDWANYQWLKTAPVIATWNGGYSVLTPAGEYYANNASKKAYNPTFEYISAYKPLEETLSYKLSADYKNVVLSWSGKNNDLVKKYVVERRLQGEMDFSLFSEISDYSVLSVSDVVPATASFAEYRLKVVGKDDAVSTYSAVVSFIKDLIASAPTDLKGTAIATTIVDLTWTNVEKARGYTIKRSTSPNGVYGTVASNVTATTFRDNNLNPNTTYYYKISSLNSGGESAYSNPVAVSTLSLAIPQKVSVLSVSSADAQVNLKWGLIYDAQFYVKRSTSASGPYTTIATVASGVTQFKDLSVINGTVYYYKVSAFNSFGEGVDSDYVVAKPNSGQNTYYDFNEVKTTTPYDNWGNHSANILGTNSWVSGKTGEAIQFDGSSSYMDIEDGVVQNLTNFTISTWVKLDAISTWSRIFDFGTGTNVYMFLTPQNGANNFYRFAIKNGGAEQQINCSVTPVIGVWTHVAITMQGSVGIMYINGVEVGRKEDFTLNPSLLGLTTQNYIGKSQFSDPYLKGIIDEFRIYSVALSSTEITTLFNSTPKPSDDDNDGVYNYNDICPNTLSGEIVDAKGCSNSQIDTDKDGVVDSLDQCPNTTQGATVNSKGCSDNQLDDDNDGVVNSLDVCPNTPTGEAVNANGCFSLPANNFAITQIGESCPNKNNGQILIEATATHNYVATINNTAYNFTNNKLTLSNLAPGNYSVCINISGKTYEQCYAVEIPKSNAITARTASAADKLMVTVESGTAPYQVVVNGELQYEINNANFDVVVKPGDVLEVKTAKICEGTFSKTITLFDAVRAFPNPTSGEFDIYLPTNEDSVSIAIYSVDAKLISIANYQIENGKVHINIEKEPAGIYLVKIKSNPEEIVQIIKK